MSTANDDDDPPPPSPAATTPNNGTTTTTTTPTFNSTSTTLSNLTQAEQNLQTQSAPLYKIVLTGGPCGGKTTALARLSSYLRERGFEVITCPEAFSVLINNGMSMEYFGTSGMGSIVQGSVMDIQISLEDGFERVLRARGKPAVLLCDRGLMDGMAYMSTDEWTTFLAKRGIIDSEGCSQLREGRYNAVFHLVTAAEGAEKYYTLENNAVRTETPSEARHVDLATQRAWVGHPKLMVLDNSTNFEGKLQRLVDATASLVGLPSSLSRVTTKFLLRCMPDLKKFRDVGVKYHVFEVEKVYLYGDSPDTPPSTSKTTNNNSPNNNSNNNIVEEYSFIRKRSHLNHKTNIPSSGTAVYGVTTVQRMHDGQKIEVKRIITSREYMSAYKTRDLKRNVVRQRRISFLWKMQSFNVHMYTEPIAVKDLCILHAQAELAPNDDAGQENVDLPPFLEIDRRLQDTKEDEENYGAFNISLIK